MADEPENIEAIEENDNLEDLIDNNTRYCWKELQEKIPKMETKSLIETMVELELFVNKTLALEISKRDDAVFYLRKIIQDSDYWGDDGFGEDGIKNIIEFTKDETLEPFGRAEAVTGLVALAKTHSSHKERIIRHISDLIKVTDDIPFASLIADDLAAFQDISVLPVLKNAFRDGRINNLFIHEDKKGWKECSLSMRLRKKI